MPFWFGPRLADSPPSWAAPAAASLPRDRSAAARRPARWRVPPRLSANVPALVLRDGPFAPKSGRRARRCWGIVGWSREFSCWTSHLWPATSRILTGDSHAIAGNRFFLGRNLFEFPDPVPRRG